MSYYHNLVTQKSWEELKGMQRKIRFILIGGWAVYLYSKTLKSKDIDIIVDFDALPKIARLYELTKNDRLKKYEARKDEVQIDIYLPHYSNIGLPVEELIDNTHHTEGFVVLDQDYLFVVKLVTFSLRAHSPKGRKDFIDLLSLYTSGRIDAKKVGDIIKEYKLTDKVTQFYHELSQNSSIPELNHNTHQFAKIKQRLLSEIKSLDVRTY